MPWFRNLSASEVDRIQRSVKRSETKSPLRHGTMTEGVLRIAGSARIEFEGDANLPDIPLATPTRSGLMTAEYAAKVEGAPEILVASSVGTRVQVGGVTTFYDSGPRDITNYATNVTAGSSFRVRRTLDSLIFTYSLLFGSAGSGSLRVMNDLPVGWRPLAPVIAPAAQGADLKRHDLRFTANAGFIWNFLTNEDGTTTQSRPTSGSLIEGTLTIPAQASLPSSLIGSPA